MRIVLNDYSLFFIKGGTILDDIFQLLYQSMVTLKEMEELRVEDRYTIQEYIKKQTELNNTIVETIRLMVFKKD